MFSSDADRLQSRLEQTLGQWQQWQCQPLLPALPRLEGPIPGGLSNHNFLVSAGTSRFVVRLDGINPHSHGLSRHFEWRTTRAASDARIAPSPRYFNPDLGAMVFDYLEADGNQTVGMDELANLIRSIHALAPGHHRVDIGQRIQRYQHRLAREARPGLPAHHQLRLETLLREVQETDDGLRCMTHNDLLPANLLRSGGHLMALDWEYCGMGSPWFDLAVATLGQQFTASEQNRLLEHYLGEPPSSLQTQALQRYRAIARYIDLLWHLAETALENIEQQ
jgi:thiamine kinase-like enzyme